MIGEQKGAVIRRVWSKATNRSACADTMRSGDIGARLASASKPLAPPRKRVVEGGEESMAAARWMS
jgi:hypothetical protein